jgi:hypothetical protein
VVTTALITVEDVLGQHSALHGFHPIPDGVRLAHALRSGYRIVLGTTQGDENSVEFWLRINGMTRPNFYEDLLYRQTPQSDLENVDLQAHYAHQLRSDSVDVGLVVTGDARVALKVTEMGFPTIFFINPSYRWGEYRMDKKRLPRAWQDIDDEMTRQAELRAVDPRLNEFEEEPI